MARSLGAAISPALAVTLFADPAWMSVPFLLAGAIKIAYDLLLWRGFRSLSPPEESERVEPTVTSLTMPAGG